LYVSLPACNLDANSNGPAPCFSTQKDCSVCSDSSNFGFGYCSNPDDFSDTISYVSSCSVEPSGSSTGWVVSLAVILSVSCGPQSGVPVFRGPFFLQPLPFAFLLLCPMQISTVGLCVFWRVRDLRALAKAKAEALAHAADVEAEAAKNNSVTGITISAGPGAHGASHGGYNAL
jgi:hypothetical protein